MAALVAAVALAPLRISQQWISWWLGLLFSALAHLGIKPAGFVEQSKVREIQGVLAHMHVREDQYRKALTELQEAVDATEGDKKKALRHLKRTRTQLDTLSEQLSQGHVAEPEAGGQAGDPAPPSHTGLHISAGVLLLSVWWFYQQEVAGLQRKLLTVFLFPLSWFYITGTLLGSKPCTTLLPLFCACWFLVGFIAAHFYHA